MTFKLKDILTKDILPKKQGRGSRTWNLFGKFYKGTELMSKHPKSKTNVNLAAASIIPKTNGTQIVDENKAPTSKSGAEQNVQPPKTGEAQDKMVQIPASEFEKLKRTVRYQTIAIIISVVISVIAIFKAITISEKSTENHPEMWSAINLNEQRYFDLGKRITEIETQTKTVNDDTKKKLGEVQAIQQNVETQQVIEKSIKENQLKKPWWQLW